MDATEMTLTTFAAPMLKTDEILLCLNECGIHMSEAELGEPQRHKDQIKGVFLSLLETCMGITPADLIQPAGFQAMQCLSNPTLYEEAVSEIAFLRATMKLMRTCGVMDFGLKDFQYPTSRRLKKQLSAVINLIKFREDRLQMYQELYEQRAQIMMDFKEATEENEMARQAIEQEKEICVDQQAEIEQIENDNMDLENQIAILNKQQAATRLESGNLKKSLNQLKDEAATLSIELHEFQAEQRKLEAQVVQSPERKKKEMIDASKSIQDERHSRDEAEAKVYHGKLCLKNVDQTEQYLNKCSALYEEAFVVQAKYDEICIETQKADESIEENKRKALEIDVLVSHSRRELQRNEERIARLRQQVVAKKTTANAAYESAQSDLLVVEKERRDGLAKVEAIEAQVRAKKEQLRFEREKQDSEISHLIDTSYKSAECAVLQTIQKNNSLLSVN